MTANFADIDKAGSGARGRLALLAKRIVDGDGRTRKGKAFGPDERSLGFHLARNFGLREVAWFTM